VCAQRRKAHCSLDLLDKLGVLTAGATDESGEYLPPRTVRAARGAQSGLSVPRRDAAFCGGVVWARAALRG
jgi:hypothetical protein